MEAVRYYTEALNVYIGASTFGRIFRLEGSGHVSATSDDSIQHLLNGYIGLGDQEFQVHNRNPGWADNLLHHGVHHCRQRSCLIPNVLCESISTKICRLPFLLILAAIAFVAPPTRRIPYVRRVPNLTCASKVCYPSSIANLD
jgi:hypothetical protein